LGYDEDVSERVPEWNQVKYFESLPLVFIKTHLLGIVFCNLQFVWLVEKASVFVALQETAVTQGDMYKTGKLYSFIDYYVKSFVAPESYLSSVAMVFLSS
jgi:hypothetical protein